MASGGKHGGNQGGRPKKVPEAGMLNKGVASGIFNRIKELNLKNAEGKPIETAEDYGLERLRPMDAGSFAFYDKCCDRIWGRPAQGVFAGDTRETTRALDFGDLPNLIPAQPGDTGKPN